MGFPRVRHAPGGSLRGRHPPPTHIRRTWPVAVLALALPAHAEKPTRLVLLGTAGGPTPKKMRAAPAQAIEIGDAIYLVDCGNGGGRQRAIAGGSLRNLS